MWIFKNTTAEIDNGCPKCFWPSYGARYALGGSCYRDAVTQKPWYDKKMQEHGFKLQREIGETK